MIRRRIFWSVLANAMAGAAGMTAADPGADAPDTIYVGGAILTMRGPEPKYAEALAVRGGTIRFVGPAARRAGHAKCGPAGAIVKSCVQRP